MKTKNNVQKTTLTLAVLFSGLLTAGTTSASDSASTVNLKNSPAITIEIAVDSKIEVESWMTNESYFTPATMIETATDSPMEVESWMVSESTFAPFAAPEAATDGTLEIENWMTDESNFSATFTLDPAVDEPLEIQDWMTDGNLFDNSFTALASATEVKLEIDGWMLNEDHWK